MNRKGDSEENVFLKYLIEPQLVDQGEKFFNIMVKINDAHTLMLLKQGIISSNDSRQLLTLSQELSKKGVKALDLDPKKEDLYLNMEAYIIRQLGDYVGGKLHTGRSRNDLYAAIQRLKCREELLKIIDLLLGLRQILLDIAEDNVDKIIPGYTHMQPAQPITYAHYLSAHCSAIKRDFDRLIEAYKRTNLNPMGAGALAGTGFNIDRTLTGKYLGFDGDLVNTLDAVASRDYVAETVSGMTIFLSTISRMNQDFYFWVTSEFSIIKLPDEFVAGSSIMPQKRNPILFEHIVSKVAHVLGAFVSIVTTMKGLPYTHTRATGGEVFTLLWKAFYETEISLRCMTFILPKIEINEDNALMNTKKNFSTVTEVADEIVRNMDVSFRMAHEIVRHAVLRLIKQGKTSEDLSIVDLDESSMEILNKPLQNVSDNVIREALDPLENVKRRNVLGGPAPTEVMKNIEGMRNQLEQDVLGVKEIRHIIQSADDIRQKRIFEIISG